MYSHRQGRPLVRRRSLLAVAWTLSTYCYKQCIRWQDRYGRYSYAAWIRTVEHGLLKRAQSRAAGAELSVGVVIAGGDVTQAAAEKTLRSLFQQELDWQIVFLLPAFASCRQAGWFQALMGSGRVSVMTVSVDFTADQWPLYAAQLPGDWLVLLEAGTQLAPVWGHLLRGQAAQTPLADVIYWDEDQVGERGQRIRPFFKPDWSPELLYSLNYLRTAAFRKAHLLACPERAASGWTFEAAAAARLVAHLPFVLEHHPRLLPEQSTLELVQHAHGVQAHLERCGYRQVAVGVNENGLLRARWQGDQPLVSIIIPTRNNLDYIRRCLKSLLEKTRYPRLEILLMDDHSSDPGVLAYYQEVLSVHACVHLHHNQEAFNYSRVNNQGARLARGDLLLFLNNDVEILTEDWLDELVRWVQLPGVGMAGARLLYPDGLIQHAGIVIGMTGHANHVFAGDCPPQNELVYSVDWYRNVSAVTGACMLVRRAVFEQLGGFNEALSLVFNDVELGQRLLRAGQRIVYTPEARLIHYEGRSRARYIPPENIRLGAELLAERVASGDPYYSPNLSLAVHWPTFRRASDPQPIKQLKAIVRFKG